jgi:transposase-like protein
VLEGLRGEETIAELCRREGIAQSLYYKWSKEFLEAGKSRLAGDTKRQASSDDVDDLREENAQLKQLVAELALKNRVLVPLCAYLQSCYGDCTGIAFIDSTPLVVCHNRRIHSHKVFDGPAARGRNSVDWFYGFKLHVVVNDRGELLACRLTAGNIDDRAPVPKLVKDLWGKLFADKGYLSQPLFEQLLNDYDLQLITKLKSNMKNRLPDAAFRQAAVAPTRHLGGD